MQRTFGERPGRAPQTTAVVKGVDLRFFGGLSANETVEVLKGSPDTVVPDWTLAEAWLAREWENQGRVEMPPERWQRIERLYHAALEREESQRMAYLQEVCAGDDALRQEVGSL